MVHMNNHINLNNNLNVGNKNQQKEFVVVSEIWTNLFSPQIFKTATEPGLNLIEVENQEPDESAAVETEFDFEQDEDGDLVFQKGKENIYSEDIRTKASQLFNLLNQKNTNTTGDKLREVYKAFAEFRCSLSCYLDSKKNPEDIYNYYNWCPWISNSEFKQAEKKLLELQKKLYDPHLEKQCARFVKAKNKQSEIEKLGDQKKTNNSAIQKLKIDQDGLSNQLKALKAIHWYHVALWFLFIVPGLMYEISRFYRINSIEGETSKIDFKMLEIEANNRGLQTKIDKLDTNIRNEFSTEDDNATRNIFEAVKNVETEIENIKLKIFKESHPDLMENMRDDKIQDIIFNVERQLNTLQQYEVFFNNLLLQLNDQEFLNRINGKSLDEFFRDESNNFVVNFIDKKKQGFSPENAKVAKLAKPKDDGATKNTYTVNLNGEDYYLKGGHLFLDELRERLGLNNQCIVNLIDMQNCIDQNGISIFSEVYRGNLKFETNNWYNVLPNEKAMLFEKSIEQEQTLIDTALHGLAENIFANFLGLGNFLVDSKLAMTEHGYSILMKKAEGEIAYRFVDNLCTRQNVNLGLSNFLFCHNVNYINPKLSGPGVNSCVANMQVNNCLNTFGNNQLNNLQNNNLVSPQLQNSILWINILDYICGNFDRHCGNYFVSKDKVTGIDSEGVFPVDNNPNRALFMPLTLEDLPHLIPFATEEQHLKIRWLATDEGKIKVADAIKIAVKTADQDTLNKVITATLERINSMYNHFLNLKSNGMIFDNISRLNSQTAFSLAAHSRIVSSSKQYSAHCNGTFNNFTGTGFVLWTVTDNNVLPALNPKPRDENSLF